MGIFEDWNSEMAKLFRTACSNSRSIGDLKFAIITNPDENALLLRKYGTKWFDKTDEKNTVIV